MLRFFLESHHVGGKAGRGISWYTEMRRPAAYAFGTTVLLTACSASLAEGLAG